MGENKNREHHHSGGKSDFKLRNRSGVNILAETFILVILLAVVTFLQLLMIGFRFEFRNRWIYVYMPSIYG